jgi:hypothetical protein
VIAEVKDLARPYGSPDPEGDKYAPGFVAEQFRSHGLWYRFSDLDRSQLYLNALPLVNAGQVRLLNHPELLRELRGLERRRGPSGRDRADHRPGSHDDIANATCGAIVLAARLAAAPRLAIMNCYNGVRTAAEVEEDTERERQERLRESAERISESLMKRRFWFPNDDESIW